MPTPTPQLTPLNSPAPSRADRSTFSDRVDAFVTWLIMVISQFNILSAWVVVTANEMFSNAVAAAASATSAAASATQASTAATTLVNLATVTATNGGELTVALGEVSFAVQTGKDFKPGMPVRFAVTASPGVRMDGYIKTYDGTTGLGVFESEFIKGSGAHYAWTVTFTGPVATAAANGLASRTLGITVNRVLTVLSNQLQQISARSGVGVVMPDAALLLPGPRQFTISNLSENISSNDLALISNSGAVLGYLYPDFTTDAHLNADSSWTFPEASPVGRPVRYAGDGLTRFAGANGTFTKIVKIDNDRILILLHGVSLHAMVYNQTTNAFGAMTLVRTAWATTGGSYDNVVATLTATDQVMVASIPDGTISLQTVILTLDGVDITVGTALTTAASGAVSTRLLELAVMGTSVVLMYVTNAGTYRMRAHTITGTTITAGSEVAGPATAMTPAFLAATASVFMVVSSSVSALSITPYSVTGNVITVGTAATTTVTTVNGITVKKNEAGRWYLTFINTTARIMIFSIGGMTVAVTTILTTSLAVTTVTALQTYQYFYDIVCAVTGTNAAGGFVTEFSAFTDQASGPAVQVGTLYQKESLAAQSVMCLGSNNTNTGGGIISMWLISSAKGTELHTFLDTGFTFGPRKIVKLGPLNSALAQPIPAGYPKQNVSNYALSKFGSLSGAVLSDGSKPALYSVGEGFLRPLRHTPALIADPINGARGTLSESLWLANASGADNFVMLDQVRCV